MQLYINTYGAYIHVKDQMFEIRVSKEGKESKHLFSAKKIESIFLSKGTALSSDAVKLAIMNNIDIVFIDWDGRPLGRVWHSKLGSTSLIRKKQLEASLGKEGLKAVKIWITDKINNEAEYLKKLKKHRTQQIDYLNEKIARLEELSGKVAELEANAVSDVAEQIRGLEGTAGRLFYEALSHLLPKAYQFNGRSSRPAKDPFNAFLNYAFGMLYGKVEKSLILAGLDPYLGYLHRDDYNQLSFVFDFIEPYRIFAIDTVFKLFTAKKVNKSHTDEIANGYSLNKKGKELLVESYNKYMDGQNIRYRGRNHTRSHIILADARRYANELIKKENKPLNIEEI